MDEPVQRYERLGRRTLAVFLLRSSWILIVILLILASLGAFAVVLPVEWSSTVTAVLWIGGLLALIAIAGTLGTGWLEYVHYGVTLGETDFRFRHGIITQEEIGIPYRRVNQVKVGRSPFEIMLGVSTLTVTLTNDEEESEGSTIKISALDYDLATAIQEELLRRAEVEKIDVAGGRAALLH